MLGSSVSESQFASSLLLDALELRREDDESSIVGKWLRLRFSTTDCGRTLCANVLRRMCIIGVA